MARMSAKPVIVATLCLSIIGVSEGLAKGHVMIPASARLSEAGRVRAPEFVNVDAWLNTSHPLTLRQLRGQVVLLDFWTYCCINCMHIFPDLKYLEEKYRSQPFVVIGVHSGKFDTEKDPANIRQAILRHNIAHPVAVDSDYQVWNRFGVRAWPTLVLIDPQGYVAGVFSGEGHRDAIDRKIAQLLDEHRKKGTLGQPIQFTLERASFESGVLEFPGKVLADAQRNRLYISDTNHHRILVTRLDGQVQHVMGTGKIGLIDGAFDEARFHQPQGMALSSDGQTLFVADTENHTLRAVHLTRQKVETIAGTGQQSYDYRAEGPGTTTPLSSPWDLARVGDKIYIAMAGTHQIWVYDLKTKRIAVFAGTGREAGMDGANRNAAFAQPSGLATDGAHLYVADSEISSIRVVELKRKGITQTLAGSGGLFVFGLREGAGKNARFQHPLGVAFAGGSLFVADTFNHVIRQVDTATGQVTTWFNTSNPSDGKSDAIALFEPGGLSVAGDVLYVADTNHHRIVAINIKTKQAQVVNLRLNESPM